MAEQGRYDRDYARGSYYDEDERGYGRDRGREEGRGRRSEGLFGSGWAEREERGWGSSGGGSERGGSWPGGERDRDERSSRDRYHERGDRFGRDDHRSGLPIEETGRLIASNKVEGTAVYGLDGERLGTIYNFMVEKVAGRVEYAVMTYGGFLGMGTRYYPIPWRMLKYDTRRGGYRVDLTVRDLERAPSFDRATEPRFDRAYEERVHNWYGLNY